MAETASTQRAPARIRIIADLSVDVKHPWIEVAGLPRASAKQPGAFDNRAWTGYRGGHETSRIHPCHRGCRARVPGDDSREPNPIHVSWKAGDSPAAVGQDRSGGEHSGPWRGHRPRQRGYELPSACKRRIEESRMSRSVPTIVACLLVLFSIGGLSMGTPSRIGLVVDASLDRPAEHGLSELEKALHKQGLSVQRVTQAAATEPDVLILAGVASGDGPAARTLRELNCPMPEGPEALVIRRTEVEGKPGIILCGSDARGLMYAALDAADRISWSENTRILLSIFEIPARNPMSGSGPCPSIRCKGRTSRAACMTRLTGSGISTCWPAAGSTVSSVIFGYENGGFMARRIRTSSTWRNFLRSAGRSSPPSNSSGTRRRSGG